MSKQACLDGTERYLVPIHADKILSELQHMDQLGEVIVLSSVADCLVERDIVIDGERARTILFPLSTPILVACSFDHFDIGTPGVGKLQMLNTLPFVHTQQPHRDLHPFRGAAVEMAPDPLVYGLLLLLPGADSLWKFSGTTTSSTPNFTRAKPSRFVSQLRAWRRSSDWFARADCEPFCEPAANRLQQLENKEKWWARRDSNPQPSGYEPPALTIELQAPHAGCLVFFRCAHKAFAAGVARSPNFAHIRAIGESLPRTDFF